MKTKYLIDEKICIDYRDNKYYLRIRSRDINNPVILFLHGGPGTPDRGQTMHYQSPLADKFTLVCFDQRGSGLAYDKKEPDITVDMAVEDTHNVVDYLKERFNKEKLIIVGHSFGTQLAIWFLEKYSQDVQVFIGIGQVVENCEAEKISYEWCLEQAKQANDKASVRILEKIGSPINGKYKNEKDLIKERNVLNKMGGFTHGSGLPYWRYLLKKEIPVILREYGLCGAIKYAKGLTSSLNTSLAAKNPDFMNTAKTIAVPLYLTLGKYDHVCATELGIRWFNQVEAPEKKLIIFDNSGHCPQWEESEKWNETILDLLK
jgi:pimeloyl-ACP methyl ester carboxylesterase